MIRLITVTLLFSVLRVTGLFVPHHYHFVNEKKTWTEAQNHCRVNYVDLASITNLDEMKTLEKLLKDKSETPAWIGLKENSSVKKWRSSLSDETFHPNGGLFVNWFTEEPNGLPTQVICVNMYKQDGRWSDDQCSTRHPFVCYDQNTSTSSLIVINEYKTWSEAQRYCREKHIDLVSVRNQTENNEIQKIMTNVSGDFIWIGLFRDSWEWSEQNNSSFRYWKADQVQGGGDNKCASVKKSENPEHYYWDDVQCNTKLPFICHENKLILIKQNLTWRDAISYCRNNHDDLLSVTTEKIQRWVEKVAQDASTPHVWLGLRHALGFWFWVEGEVLCYQNWAPGTGPGTEECSDGALSGAVESSGDHKWISMSENVQLNFICST